MNYSAVAFFTGLFGSLHCVAMCGPLLMALPLSDQSNFVVVLQRLLYQVGRISVYMIMGLILGWVGSSLSLLGWQKGVSIISGLLLVGIAIFHLSNKKSATVNQWQIRLITPLSRQMGKVLVKSYGSFFAGMLNGLIPCGMVYLALAGAINSVSLLNSVSYMLYFGLGTTPLMLTASLTAVYLKKSIRFNFSSLLPYLSLCMGIWLVLRGVQLGIPFISPAVNTIGGEVCQ